MIKLSSGISRELKGYFILDENGLRKIAGVLTEQSKELPYPCAIVFHVKREDDRFYETMRVEDVLTDANILGHRIELLRIELRNSDPNKVSAPWERDWIVAVQFNSNGDTQNINVAYEDRKLALALADAVEPQVIGTLTAKKISAWVLIPTYVAVAIFLHTLAQSVGQFAPDVISVATPIMWLGAIALIFSSFEDRSKFVSKWAGPKSSFHWGEQAISYTQFESFRQNILWVAIAGFAVSVAATFFTNTLIPQPPESNPSTAASATKVPPERTN